MTPDKFLDFLRAEILRFDRLCAETEWRVDSQIYNGCAHALRRVRDEYLKGANHATVTD